MKINRILNKILTRATLRPYTLIDLNNAAWGLKFEYTIIFSFIFHYMKKDFLNEVNDRKTNYHAHKY